MMKMPKVKRRTPNDKIFDNSFNSGEIDYEHFGEVQIDRSYSISRMNEYNNSFEYFQNELLHKKIQAIYKKTEWRKQFKNRKKIPKSELPEMYNFFYEKLKGSLSSDCEIFVTFSDFFGVNYKILYNMVPYQYKSNILKELDEKYKIIDKKKMRRLF